jgi:hypothetical protein
MEQPGRTRWIRLAALAVVLVGTVGAVWAAWSRIDPDGDPGGQVMDQLTPTLAALPGDGTPALPTVSQLPTSPDAPYVITMEPHRDSCDGRPGTQGWSQVVVQAGFHWTRGLPQLVARMAPRLAELGWKGVRQPPTSGTATWSKPLRTGGDGFLSVSSEGDPSPSFWQFDVTGDAIGKAASGC